MCFHPQAFKRESSEDELLGLGKGRKVRLNPMNQPVPSASILQARVITAVCAGAGPGQGLEGAVGACSVMWVGRDTPAVQAVAAALLVRGCTPHQPLAAEHAWFPWLTASQKAPHLPLAA